MQNYTSPVTGIIEEDLVIIDFGQHEGRSVFEVSETDPPFYGRLIAAKDIGNFAIRRKRDKSFRLYCTNYSEFDRMQIVEEEPETTEVEVPVEAEMDTQRAPEEVEMKEELAPVKTDIAPIEVPREISTNDEVSLTEKPVQEPLPPLVKEQPLIPELFNRSESGDIIL